MKIKDQETKAGALTPMLLIIITILLLVIFCVNSWQRGQQKTHSRFQPWVLVEIALIATRANGIAGYDDYQNYLSNLSKHCESRIAR